MAQTSMQSVVEALTQAVAAQQRNQIENTENTPISSPKTESSQDKTPPTQNQLFNNMMNGSNSLVNNLLVSQNNDSNLPHVDRSLPAFNVPRPTQEQLENFKRPPHTYPSLIAQAILDSNQNLITLRGIYEYIMEKYPYYKFCHDKSAWQNSIRHNLSLNQCFIKGKFRKL